MLASFFLITYVFLYIHYWCVFSNSQNELSAHITAVSNARDATRFLSNAAVQTFFVRAGYYTLNRINNYSIKHPLFYDPTDELSFLRSAFDQIMVNGKAKNVFKDGSTLSFDKDEVADYTFKGFINTTNKTLNYNGYYISGYVVKLENFSYVSPVVFNITYRLNLFITDYGHTFETNKTYVLHHLFNITGFVDPYIARESAAHSLTGKMAEKQIYFKPLSPKSLKPVLIKGCDSVETCKAKHMQGQGFFYGPVVTVDQASKIPVYERQWYILFGSYDKVVGLNSPSLSYTQFGAVILNNTLDYEKTDCTSKQSEKNTFNAITYQGYTCLEVVKNKYDKPFVLVPHLKYDDLPLGPDGYRRVLFVAKFNSSEVASAPSLKYNGVLLYNIEKLRDFEICGYYIPSRTGISYPQRLSGNTVGGISKYGMITFVVGQWAGGAELPSFNKYSHVAWQFYTMQPGIKIRGMSGCKRAIDCSAHVGFQAPLGQFALSEQYITLFDLQNISCNNGWASCK